MCVRGGEAAVRPSLNAFCVFDMTEGKTCFLAIFRLSLLCSFTAAASLSRSVALSPPPSTKLYPEIYDSKNFLALSSARTAAAAAAAHRCLTGGASERGRERERERGRGRKDNITNHGMAQRKKGREEDKARYSGDNRAP